MLLYAAKRPTLLASIAAWQHDADTNVSLSPWRIGWGIAVYHMLRQHQPYRDYRTTVPGQHAEQQLVKKLQQRVERLGYQLQLVPIAATPPPS